MLQTYSFSSLAFNFLKLAQTCMFYCTNRDLYEMTLHVCMFVPLTYQG